MNRTILKPQVDVPLVVLLDKGPEGRETTAKSGGIEYQYTLNNDQAIIWLPPEARGELLRTGARAGDTVQIVKSLRGRAAVWNVQVLPDSAEPPTAAARVFGGEPQPNTRVLAPRPAYANAPAPSQPAQAGAARHQAQQIAPDPQGWPTEPAPAPPAPATSHPFVDAMAHCIVLGAHANWRAYTAVRNAGIEIAPPTWEDCRAAGISMFIERSKQQNGGGR